MQTRMISRNSSRNLVWGPYFSPFLFYSWYTANFLSQLCCTTQIAIPAAKMKSQRDFKESSLHMKFSLIPTSAQSMIPIVFGLTTSTELVGTSVATLGPMLVASIPLLPKLQLLVLVLHNLPRPLLELSDIRTLRHLGNLPTILLKKEPKLGEAHMKPGRG